MDGPGDLGWNPARVIPKTQKWYLMPPCLTLSIIRYGTRIKWSNPGKGVAPSTTPWCSSYRNGSLQVTLANGHQLYFLLLPVKKLRLKSEWGFLVFLCVATIKISSYISSPWLRLRSFWSTPVERNTWNHTTVCKQIFCE